MKTLDRRDAMNETETLTIADVLSSSSYIIPLYQRNFAWEEKEVDQLLRDIFENNNETYYIGTLVVSELKKSGKIYEEVIDGQQRLTALNIIYSVIAKELSVPKKYEVNLSFESREKSNSALKLLRERGDIDSLGDGGLDNFLAAVRTVKRFCSEAMQGDKDELQNYLYNKLLRVCIFKVRLHNHTDKNHYFEVMNNRGEQLESHEVVKAKLMDSLNSSKERETFAVIWDACSNMEGRLEKNSNVRGLWGSNFNEDPLKLDTFEKISERINIPVASNVPAEDFSISNIEGYVLSKSNPQEESKQDKQEEEYNSVIDFPNFLLQVLELGEFKDKVRLDAGKFLLDEFGCVGELHLPDAKEFLVKLLRFRILFDKFIIKRRRTDKTSRGWKWVIETPKSNSSESYTVNTFNVEQSSDADDFEDSQSSQSVTKSMWLSRRMCMLQAMFFVTFRRDVYMRWLSKALECVNNDPTGNSLLNALEDYSVWFIKNSRESDGVESNEYKKGLAIHHFVFNFLDYQLWKMYYCKIAGIECSDLSKFPQIDELLERKGVRVGFKYFVFTRRNSIEHYYAQEKGAFHGIPNTIINDFGNLALISGGLNSKLSNRDCSEKKEYHDAKNPASLKYELMLSEDIWNEQLIQKHGRLMAEILIEKSDGFFEPYEK